MLMRIQCQIAAVLLRSQMSMGTELWSTVFGACETTILWLAGDANHVDPAVRWFYPCSVEPALVYFVKEGK